MIVRRVTPQDFESLLVLIKYQVGELEADEIYDHNTAIENLRVAATKNQYFCFIALEGTRPVGFITGYATNSKMYSDKITVNIANCFLLASHRDFNKFEQLLQAAKDWAALAEAKQIAAEFTGLDTMDQMIKEKLTQRYDIAMMEI